MTASWVDDDWLAIDTETTGVDAFSDRVVEVAAVHVHPDGSTGTAYTAVVNPGVDIPDGAASIHGITTARARDEGIPTAEAVARIAEIVFSHGHRPVVMYNAVFDWPILISEAERHGLEFPVMAPVLDPLCIDRMVEADRQGKRKLFLVAQHYGVEFDETEAHGALADAVAAARVMRQIVQRHPAVGTRSLASVYVRQVRGHERWRQGMLEEYPRMKIPPGWPVPALIAPGKGIPTPLPETSGEAVASEEVPAASPVHHADLAERARAALTGQISDDAAPPAASEGDEGVGEAPSAGDAEPAPSPAVIGTTDIAKLAGKVFAAAGAAAPKGQKTRTIERLRHALVYAQLGGRSTSMNDCDSTELHKIYRRLQDIDEGRLLFATDDNGVTFVMVGTDTETTVTWAQLEPGEAA